MNSRNYWMLADWQGMYFLVSYLRELNILSRLHLHNYLQTLEYLILNFLDIISFISCFS